MNRIAKFLVGLVLVLGATLGFAQVSLTQTTLSAAINSSQTTLQVASATNISAGTELYIDTEAFSVASITGTLVKVAPRGSAGTKAFGHISGAAVLVGPPQAFIGFDPSGACTAGSGLFQYTPVVNINNGNEWLCSSVLNKVVPGWNNQSTEPNVTAAIASGGTQITPSGPLFHVTGSAAITGFILPVGFDPKEGQTLCIIPDGAFTTTTANNIAVISTAVVGRVLCWAYDPNTAKFYPYY